ncbi:MAG TPA: sporulation protein [Thermoanaerobaculia bacterium]|jgi:sporulation-control protein spo0M
MIRLDLAQDAIQNGDHVRGRAQWTSEGKDARKLEVLCRWRVEGKGSKHEEIIDLEIDVAPGAQATIPFDFEIPMDGPLSYEGKLFRIVWEIVARADLPLAFDTEETKPFTVRPRPYVPEEFEEPEDEEDEDEEEEGEEEEEDSGS